MKIISSFGLGTDALKNGKKFNCILGISVGSRDFSKEDITKYLEFCLKQFDKTLIIIVDDIKKYNWMSIDNISETEASKKAEYEGMEMTVAVKKVIKFLKQEKHDISRIQTYRWNEIKDMIPEYDKTVKILEEHMKKDVSFKNDALIMTDKYLDAKGKKELNPEKKEIAIQFLIREMALFLLIGKSTKEHYCIDVYPGKFPVMEKLLTGKYGDILEKLPKNILYGHIEIKK